MDLASILDIVAKIILIIGVPIGFIQLKLAYNRRNAQTINDVIREIGSEDVKLARYDVLNMKDLKKKEDFDKLSKKQKLACRRIAVAYDRVGFFIKNHLIPTRAFIKWQGSEIKMLWAKLKIVVEYIRDKENRPDYCKYFQYLGENKVTFIRYDSNKKK